MYLLGLGVILLVLKYLEFGWVGQLSWWLVLTPFGLALLWWEYADASGYSKRKAMEKMEKRKSERQARSREALGLGTRRK